MVSVQLISTFVFATDTTVPLHFKCGNFKPPAVFYSCTAPFVMDLVGHPEDRFSHDGAQVVPIVFLNL